MKKGREGVRVSPPRKTFNFTNAPSLSAMEMSCVPHDRLTSTSYTVVTVDPEARVGGALDSFPAKSSFSDAQLTFF